LGKKRNNISEEKAENLNDDKFSKNKNTNESKDELNHLYDNTLNLNESSGKREAFKNEEVKESTEISELFCPLHENCKLNNLNLKL
jgi:hypothetical protein